MSSLSLPLAFFAGLLSMLSPCVFSLVPVYLGYLSGATLSGEQSSRAADTWRVLSHALAFVVGFTVIFVVVLGLPTTLLSGFLVRYGDWITRIGGLVLILFGMHTLQWVHIPLFGVTRRVEMGKGLEPGYLRSVLFGASFAAGWSPCVGPLLGLVMTLAFSEPARAMVFMLAYAMGLAVPFLLAALLLSQMMGWMQALMRHSRTIEWISGGLMILVGVLMVSGLFGAINSFLIQLTPGWLMEHL